MTKIFIRILKKLGLLSTVNIYVKKRFKGKKFIIPFLNGMGYDNLCISEPWMDNLLNALDIDDTKLFVDVGANIGQTLLTVKSFRSDIQYIGIEPNPSCVFYLYNLIQKNEFKNTTILPIAIGSENDIVTMEMYSSEKTDQSASIIENFRPGNRVFNSLVIPSYDLKGLEIRTLMQNITILKIDVEGSELKVLTSFLNIVKKESPYIIMEILPVYSKELSERLERQKRIQEILETNNYNIYRIYSEKFVLKKIDEFTIDSKIDLCNYLFVPDLRMIDFVKKCAKEIEL